MPLFLEGQDPRDQAQGPALMHPMGKPEPSIGQDFATAAANRPTPLETAIYFWAIVLVAAAILFALGWLWRSKQRIAGKADNAAVAAAAGALKVWRRIGLAMSSYGRRIAEKADE